MHEYANLAEHRRTLTLQYCYCPRCGEAGNYFGEYCHQGDYLVVELHCDNCHGWEVRFLLPAGRLNGHTPPPGARCA
jgi:hypothetical protein